MDEDTRLIHSGLEPQELVRTVGPPVQKGSTVLLPDAAALYDDDKIT
jgi:cysteine-S-conjugate beta-lyase